MRSFLAGTQYLAHDGRLGISVGVAPGDELGALVYDGNKHAAGRFLPSIYGWLYNNGASPDDWGLPGLGYGMHQFAVRIIRNGDQRHPVNLVGSCEVPDPPATSGSERIDYHHPELLLPALWDAGFRDEQSLLWCLAIAEGESGLYVKARNWLPSDGFRPAGTVVGVEGPAAAWDQSHLRQGHSDRGVFQINSKAWPQFTDADCDNVETAARTMWRIVNEVPGGGWWPWGFGEGGAHYAPYFDGAHGYPPLRPLVAAFVASH